MHWTMVPLIVVVPVFAAGGAWAGVKAALKRLDERIGRAEKRIGNVEHRVHRHEQWLDRVRKAGL